MINLTRSIPIFKNIQNIVNEEEIAIQFLLDSNILFNNVRCTNCNGPTKRKRNLWVCIKKSCAKAISIFKGSFFQNSKIKCNEVLHIAYLWLAKVKATSIITITGNASDTITAYIKHLNQLIADNIREEDCIIGGQNIIVEIDECKIAKIKYHRGHPVEGAWIVGGIERTIERRFFCEVVENRTKDTLHEIITRRIRPGSIVHTDCHRGYIGIEEYNLTHKTVNHSLYFKDPETGVHTNTIEGTWAGLKASIPVRNRNKNTVEGDILSFIWRRQNHLNLWGGFLNALKNTLYY